ncbi:hypothetical protein [Maribacter halichondriae]|uniref:hypothetical protein n=1 Tax=Maribacter halichondriae TaxID=2980554 RepID=UPI0023580ED5|nr:hypothetical protein [Maribacter sp. Hal144]
MRKNILNFIITILVAVVLSQFLPWWSIMVAGFLTGFSIPLKRIAVFLVPFLAIALFWAVSAYMISSGNDFTLAKRIAVLFPLDGNVNLLLLITGIIGGLAAGIAALFGKQCQLLFKKS